MSYLALARKWRPRNFGELAGQEHVMRALVNALQTGRVHHAFLFTGNGNGSCYQLDVQRLLQHGSH